MNHNSNYRESLECLEEYEREFENPFGKFQTEKECMEEIDGDPMYLKFVEGGILTEEMCETAVVENEYSIAIFSQYKGKRLLLNR